jgi:hypothetical protein
MTHADALAFAEVWVAAWNAHDLGRILSHYADDCAPRRGEGTTSGVVLERHAA